MVLSFLWFFSILSLFKIPVQYFGPKSPQVINFWGAKVTPSLGSQATQIFNFITSVGSEHLPFPKLPYFKFQNNYVRMSSVFYHYISV